MTVRPRPLLRAAVLLGLLCAALLWPAAPAAVAQPVAPPAPVPATVAPLVRVSNGSPFPEGCAGPAGLGTNFRNTTVEPHIAVNPRDPAHVVAAWQQDRWSNGGAAGNAGAVSRDGGATWTLSYPPHSRCAGGDETNGGDFDRASDPWVSFAPNGDVYFMSLTLIFSQELNRPVVSAMLVSRSTDGGRSWDPTVTLARDALPLFHDKNVVTADPTDSRYAYAVWDRITMPTREDLALISSLRGGETPTPEQQAALERTTLAPRLTLFARTTDGGQSWEPPRAILTLRGQQSIGNEIVVLPDGTLLNVFTLLDDDDEEGGPGGVVTVQRSTDHGDTWSAPLTIAPMFHQTVTDPATRTRVRTGPLVQAAVDPGNGTVYVVWQDSSPSGNAHDEVVLTTSTDGGFNWTETMVVSRSVGGPAFVPNLAVLPDGLVGVAYYDFRRIEPDAGAPPVNYWLTLCRSGCTDRERWFETRVGSAFDLTTAARTGERTYFLGDYEGLAAAADAFAVLFVRTGPAGEGTASDTYFTTAKPMGP